MQQIYQCERFHAAPRRIAPMLDSEKPYVIVVGVDYSTASDLALERALELARARPRRTCTW